MCGALGFKTRCPVWFHAALSRQVAVLDEIQMISDKSRGWSWTRALLGLPARSVHVCGDPAATELIAQLADHCGDTLTVNRYRRLSPLVVEPRALDSVGAVQEGDCLVAFGRKSLHKLRKSILATGKDAQGRSSDTDSYSSSGSDSAGSNRHGVGMVYGALPPEARRTQAALFNAGLCLASQYGKLQVLTVTFQSRLLLQHPPAQCGLVASQLWQDCFLKCQPAYLHLYF
eukprot:GHUV01028492.1.p1 GENE.GHUV01028492.1~~GHUV01028492.1.p1  ORF type:complete len:230 (-),score=5.65 GHUV01028492.1:1047-1736(-)